MSLNQLKICLVTTGYPPQDGGGIGIYSANLALGLTRLGHKVCVLSQSSIEECIEQVQGVDVYRFKFRYLPKLEKFFPGLRWSHFVSQKIMELHKKYRFDVIEFPNWEGVGFWYSLWKRRTPAVMRLHTAYFEMFPIDEEGRAMSFGDRFISWLEKRSVCQSAYLISSADYHRNLIAQHYGLDQSKIALIPLGVVIPEYNGRRINSKSTLDILCVGRLEKRKGTLTLIDSIPQVVEQYPQARFTFIGFDRRHAPGGKLFQEYFEERYPRYVDKVRFLGYMEFAKVEEFYRETDIFVLPSLCENFGLVYAEAMAWGKPAVGCNVTAIPEVVQDGETGLLIEPHDKNGLIRALDRLIQDEKLRVKMGSQARQRVEKLFSIDKMVRDTEQFYRQAKEKYHAAS